MVLQALKHRHRLFLFLQGQQSRLLQLHPESLGSTNAPTDREGFVDPAAWRQMGEWLLSWCLLNQFLHVLVFVHVISLCFVHHLYQVYCINTGLGQLNQEENWWYL